MGRFICHHEGHFFDWSTIVDAPVTSAMTREEYEDFYRERHGSEGMRELPARLERAMKNGTSCVDGYCSSLESLVVGNRAGPGEGEATLAQVLEIVGIASEPTP